MMVERSRMTVIMHSSQPMASDGLRIVFPILSPSLAIGWLLCMITVIRDLSTIILLYGAKSKMLAITFYSYWTSGAIEDAAVIGLFMALVGLMLVGGIRLLQRQLSVSEQSVI